MHQETILNLPHKFEGGEWKFLLSALALGAFGLWLVGSGNQDDLISGLFFLSLGALFFCPCIPSLAFLRVEMKGLTEKRLLSERNFYWNEIEKFEAVKSDSKKRNENRVVIYLNSSARGLPNRSCSPKPIDGDVLLFQSYRHKAKDLADKLNKTLERMR